MTYFSQDISINVTDITSATRSSIRYGRATALPGVVVDPVLGIRYRPVPPAESVRLRNRAHPRLRVCAANGRLSAFIHFSQPLSTNFHGPIGTATAGVPPPDPSAPTVSEGGSASSPILTRAGKRSGGTWRR